MADEFTELLGKNDVETHRYLDSHGYSNHSTDGYFNENNQQQPWNEINKGIGYTQTWSESNSPGQVDIRKGFTIGHYDNSFGKDTFYVGGVIEANVKVNDHFNISTGIRAGVATGYEQFSGKELSPTVQATLRAEWDQISVTAGYMPSVEMSGEKTPSVLTFNTSWKFD